MPTPTKIVKILEQGANTIAQCEAAIAALLSQGWIVEGVTFGTNGYAILLSLVIYQ